MVIVYNSSDNSNNKSYISAKHTNINVSTPKKLVQLTTENKEYLKSLGFKVNRVKRKKIKKINLQSCLFIYT